MPVYIEKINGDVDQPTDQPTDRQTYRPSPRCFVATPKHKNAIVTVTPTVTVTPNVTVHIKDFS